MSIDQEATAAVGTRCGNCRTLLAGPHCHVCGQPIKGLIRPLSGWVADFFDTMFEWDGRFPRTMVPLLVRPGYLTREYIAGRRVRYVTPVRLFLVLVIVLFIAVRLTSDLAFGGISTGGGVAPAAEDRERIQRLVEWLPAAERRAVLDHALDPPVGKPPEQATATDAGAPAPEAVAPAPPRPSQPTIRIGSWNSEADGAVRIGWLSDGINEQINAGLSRIAANARRINEDPGPFLEQVLSVAPQTLFFMLPLFALMLKLFYMFSRRMYMEHLLVALHSHSFIAATLLVVIGLNALSGWLGSAWFAVGVNWVTTAMVFWIPINLFLTQKWVYGQGWLLTTLKFLVIGTLYLLLLSVGLVVTLLLTLLFW